MDCMTAVRLLPAVREHETNRELVWQVELPVTPADAFGALLRDAPGGIRSKEEPWLSV